MYHYISKLFTLFYFLFFIVNIQSQTWRQFTKADGLPSSRFLTMTSDQQDNLWVGMTQFISRINEDLLTETFSISQAGVQLIMESSDGSVWVPTLPGLYRYNKNMKQQI